MRRFVLLPLVLLAGCGEPADRLTDEQAAAGQNASMETPVEIDVPEPTGGGVAPPPTVQASYKAVGTEPGWALTVTPKSMSYEGDYGAVTIAEPTPPAFRPTIGRYAGTRLIVTIAPGPCNDGMSDRTYRHTVTVLADGKAVSGCGGGTVADSDPAIDPASNAVVNAN